MIVRPAGASPRPTAFEFTIYVDSENDLKRLEYAAGRGYAGVIAYVRGKACSPQTIAPYEHDGRDANSVIDWIARQRWSDGQVGMMGGSYDGFTQWAAAKKDVGIEDIHDAGRPMQVDWLTSSYIRLHLRDPDARPGAAAGGSSR